jgi:hypothetical protein
LPGERLLDARAVLKERKPEFLQRLRHQLRTSASVPDRRQGDDAKDVVPLPRR